MDNEIELIKHQYLLKGFALAKANAEACYVEWKYEQMEPGIDWTKAEEALGLEIENIKESNNANDQTV